MNAPLDFPPIVDALPSEVAASKNKIAAAMDDLQKVDLHAVAMAQFGPWRTQVAETTKTLTGLVLDLSTQAKVDEAKSLRHRLIGQPRADVRKVSKALKSRLATVSKAVGAEEDAAVAAYDDAEKLITPQIDAREAELEAEREAKRQAEENRKQAHRDTIAKIRSFEQRAKGLPAARIRLGIDMLEGINPGEEFEEFQAEALRAKDETLAAMRKMLADAEVAEAEAARLEAQRQEQQRIAAELAEQKRQLDEQAAALARQRAEQEAQQRAAAPAPEAPATDTSASAEAAPAAKGKEVTPGSSQPEASPPAPLHDNYTHAKRLFIEAANTIAQQEAGQAATQATEAKASPCQAETSSRQQVLKLGDIKIRLAIGGEPLNITATQLSELGFEPIATEKAAKLYAAEDFPRICQALIDHIDGAIPS